MISEILENEKERSSITCEVVLLGGALLMIWTFEDDGSAVVATFGVASLDRGNGASYITRSSSGNAEPNGSGNDVAVYSILLPDGPGVDGLGSKKI